MRPLEKFTWALIWTLFIIFMTSAIVQVWKNETPFQTQQMNEKAFEEMDKKIETLGGKCTSLEGRLSRLEVPKKGKFSWLFGA